MKRRVVEILVEYMKVHGFDGLCNTDGGCACLIGNLAPCGCLNLFCVPGHKVEGRTEDCGEGCEWHVQEVVA